MNIQDVTLLMFDGGENVDQTVKTINHCAKLLPFGDVRCLLHKHPEIKPDCDWFIIPDMTYRGKNFFYGMLGFLFNTSHMLYCQNDGYILNPGLWRDEWLQYDYVAPPWPKRFYFTQRQGVKDYQMGCGGFCLMSRKFCKAVSMLLTQFKPPDHENVDVWFCQTVRDKMEALGVKFAPFDVGLSFGIEYPIEEFPDWRDSDSFGFHDVNMKHMPGEGAKRGRKYL